MVFETMSYGLYMNGMLKHRFPDLPSLWRLCVNNCDKYLEPDYSQDDSVLYRLLPNFEIKELL